MMRFKNPSNAYLEEISDAPVFVLLFGSFYFAHRGVWGHAVLSLVVAICTFGVSWLIYPFFATNIMRTHYLRRGWIESDPPEYTNEQPEEPKELPEVDMETPKVARVFGWMILAVLLVLCVWALSLPLR